jgi:hypothetical protein
LAQSDPWFNFGFRVQRRVAPNFATSFAEASSYAKASADQTAVKKATIGRKAAKGSQHYLGHTIGHWSHNWGQSFRIDFFHYWGQSFRIDFLICQLEDINPKGLTLINDPNKVKIRADSPKNRRQKNY